MRGIGPDIGEVVGAPSQQSLRLPFHRDLDAIRQTIARLSATVTEDVLRATDIALTQDVDAAKQMIFADHELDASCLAVEQHCYRLLALQAPVASDLREVVAALRIVAEVERSGDLAVNVANTARRLYGHSLPPRIRGLIRRMGAQASGLFREATEAYFLNDAVRAAAIPDMDDLLDELQRRLVAAIFDTADSIELPTAIQLAVVARFYERIGDHAVAIGERVMYLVSGSLHHHVA